MDNKHFIWIVPLIFILGFGVGYVSGLHIPKDIKIGLDNETLDFLNMYYNSSIKNDCVTYNYSLDEKDYYLGLNFSFCSEILKSGGVIDLAMESNNETIIACQNLVSDVIYDPEFYSDKMIERDRRNNPIYSFNESDCLDLICKDKVCDFKSNYNNTILIKCQNRVYELFFNHGIFEYKDYSYKQ